MKKILKVTLVTVLTVFILFNAFVFFRLWQLKTGRLVRLNSGQYMTSAELHKLYPTGNDVQPDKNKPEEVYTNFRNAILAENVEEALKYVSEEKRIEYKKSLVKNLELYKKIPEFKNLKKTNDYSGDVELGYEYAIESDKYFVHLEKVADGYWFIYSI